MMHDVVSAPVTVLGKHFVLSLTTDFARARAYDESRFAIMPGSFDTPDLNEVDLPDGNAFAHFWHDPRRHSGGRK